MMQMNRREAVELTRSLVEIESVSNSGNDKNILDFVKAQLDRNAECQIVHPEGAPPYLVSTLRPSASFDKNPSQSPPFGIILSGHLDTVPPGKMTAPFSAIIKDGYLHGRGAVDMKGGCAALMTAFQAFSRHEKRVGAVHLIFTLDEEVGSTGASHAIAETLPRADLAIIGEPSRLDFITSHKGCHWFEINFHGKSAHASNMNVGKNAVLMASDFIQCMNRYIATHFPGRDHPTCGTPSISIGGIQGGGPCANIVPDHCKITLDRRWNPNENMALIYQDFQEIISVCKTLDPDFNATLAVEDPNTESIYPPLDFTGQKALLERLSAAVSTVGLKEIKQAHFNGWTEGALFEQAGTPAIVFGPGDFETAHTDTECIEIDQITQAADAYFAILNEFCR